MYPKLNMLLCGESSEVWLWKFPVRLCMMPLYLISVPAYEYRKSCSVVCPIPNVSKTYQIAFHNVISYHDVQISSG